jgi:hypothetical protein
LIAEMQPRPNEENSVTVWRSPPRVMVIFNGVARLILTRSG